MIEAELLNSYPSRGSGSGELGSLYLIEPYDRKPRRMFQDQAPCTLSTRPAGPRGTIVA